MSEDFAATPTRITKQTRSASICATTGSIEAAIYNMPPGAVDSATPEGGGTPVYRRRKPATRSQSARITSGAKAARRRQQPQPPQNLQDSRTYCTSEPRLSETETPPQRRKLSQRRPQQHVQRKSNAFLDVPISNMQHLRVNDEEGDLDRLRTFSASKGGIINRGDSFRRRRSRSNSLAPSSPVHPRASSADRGYNARTTQDNQQKVDVYHVVMLGSSSVGKQALVSQFRTSDCINAYDGPECDEAEQNISIILNGIESELKFSIGRQEIKGELEKADAFLVVYSCVDKESFTRAKQILSRLQDMDLTRTRPVILIANKIDLARSRAVSAQDGKCVACTYGAKFIEVSVGINHNCDELLAGTLTQIRLKKDHNLLQLEKANLKKKKNKTKEQDITKTCEPDADIYSNDKDKISEFSGSQDIATTPHWYKSRSVVLASMKARQMLTWILGKEDSKFKNCENLQVL